jgi:hypothetical protein
VASRTFEQSAASDVSFRLSFTDDGSGNPVTVTTRSVLEVHAGERTYDVRIAMTCSEGERVVAERRWDRQFPRDLA